MNIDFSVSAALSFLAALGLAMAGWLLRRSVGAVDSKLSSIDGKLDAISKAQGDQTVAVAVLTTRIGTVELDLRDAQKRLDDHSGYLSTQGGFKPRHSDGSF
jgi:hypothetical protein